jgi:ubiquinone biosynthesis protein UbiJ
MIQNLLNNFQPPAWVVDEVQNRIVLLLNHVLMQEPQAQDRVRRQQGKTARMCWGPFDMVLRASPAGLVERPLVSEAAQGGRHDLTVTLTQTAVPDLLQTLARGDKPAVNIEGDVQLAAEVAWLVDNLRWDLEEDLSRLVGDVPAHTLVGAARTAAQGLKAFLQRLPSVAGQRGTAP